MATESLNEEDIFRTALQFEDRDEQTGYVKRACGADVELCAAVEALLQQHYAGSILDAPAVESLFPHETRPLTEGPGTVIGRYKLLEKIGEGGMAAVYMAEQTEPIRRKVALKIIKLGMDTKQVIARFEAERQALALMNHPSIAKVLDAGATETGRPYFVMELVQGVSITEYCDKNNLSTKDRLALFVQVCNAVQHAHQKGIIHRDIKPSNVMVTHHDGKPVPKVIDFGIAKATNQRLTEKTLFTRYAHIIGTPAYMSPEQAELSDLDIDTRSDIYSLGVLLYELLTGTTPFSEEELRKAGYIEMQRVIREQEPAKPSTRIRTSHVAQPPSAGRPPRHSRGRLCYRSTYEQVRGDLDWIVMKSLEKDRARRYDTPNALASDILRHLEHEPVLARGPGATYRLHKFLRRHRSQVVAILAFGVLIGVMTVVLSMWNRDRLHRGEAEDFRDRGILSHAREQYAKADREAALETIKPILDSKYVGPEAQLLHAGILVDNHRSDEAVTTLNNLLNERPEIAGAAHSLLARILWESESPNAEKLKEIDEHRQRAEALLPEAAEAYFLRAMTAVTVKEQLASLNKALQLDPGHYESRRLRAFTYYASRKYDKMREESLVMTVLRPRDPLGHSLRATAFRELARYAEAMAEYDIAIELTPEQDPQYAELSTRRSETLLRIGEYERVIAEAPVGAKDLPPLQYHVFCALTALGHYDKAAALFRQIVLTGQDACRQFENWCSKYIFDTLGAGRSWRAAGPMPAGAAFLPMVEADEDYHRLSAKGHRLTTDGFSGRWSPDGSKLVFSLGVHGYSGVATYDPATKETELLIVPGKDPRWSPDGQHIAFVRDCQALRLEEFLTAERKGQARWLENEEVWVMKADGTEPRRLARGGWPSWSRDSTCVYYHSRVDKTLCSISIVGPGAEPEPIMPCSNAFAFPSVSPDNHRIAYIEERTLKVRDLASQALLAEWRVPFGTWGGPAWSPTGKELCLGAASGVGDGTGLWIYHLDSNEPAKVLGSQVMAASWAPDGTKLVFHLEAPYLEIWTADLDPNISTIESLGPARTLEEHFREMVAIWTRRIETHPQDANALLRRAICYDSLGERAKADADMRRWSAAMSGQSPSDSRFDTPGELRRFIRLPFDCELVFSAERPVNAIPMMSVAFGQKGRYEMKLFEIPMVVTSLLGLCFLSGVDVPPARADFTFGTPVNLGPTINNGGSNQAFPCLSADGLELYFCRAVSGALYDIFVTRRATVGSEWGVPVNLGPTVNTGAHEWALSISADGLSLYYTYGGDPTAHLYVTKRATKNDDWGPPASVGGVVGTEIAVCPCISPDDLELYFVSRRSGGYGDNDLWVTTRATMNDDWGIPINLGSTINSPYLDCDPVLSPDGLLLFFSSMRPGGISIQDIYVARRATRKDPWDPSMNVGPIVNSMSGQRPGSVSFDGSMLYFFSSRSGGYGSRDIWQAPILPIVDFNGDGKVDGKEVLALAQHWGQSQRLLDIGLLPMGDGIVDANDLTVLAGYIGQEVNDLTLIAHWALDEAEGITAADSAGDNDATVLGDAAWQPAGGKIGGALAFDGKSNFARSGKSVLDPAAGAFSVIAWVKGGAANKVIVSQAGGADWLYLDQYGMLTTGLRASGKDGKTLSSKAFVPDDQWHRVVLTWDGTNRALHVDGIEVAKDSQPNLAPSSGNLTIGVGSRMAKTSFWFGLIDDVRVYNRVVQP